MPLIKYSEELIQLRPKRTLLLVTALFCAITVHGRAAEAPPVDRIPADLWASLPAPQQTRVAEWYASNKDLLKEVDIRTLRSAIESRRASQVFNRNEIPLYLLGGTGAYTLLMAGIHRTAAFARPTAFFGGLAGAAVVAGAGMGVNYAWGKWTGPGKFDTAFEQLRKTVAARSHSAAAPEVPAASRAQNGPPAPTDTIAAKTTNPTYDEMEKVGN